MANVQWENFDPITILSGELNNFAPNQIALSGEINNSLGLYLFNDIELFLERVDFANNSDFFVEIFLIQSIDGINYESGVSDGLQPSINNLVGSFIFKSSEIPQRQTIRKLVVPPRKYKYAIKNKSNIYWSNNGNTLKILGYRYKN